MMGCRGQRARRGALIVAVLSGTVVGACGSGSDAEPASLEAMVEQLPQNVDGWPYVEYFNLERLRETTGEDFVGPIIESDPLWDVANRDLTISEPFRTQLQHFRDETGSPIELEQTTATANRYGAGSLIAGEFEADDFTTAFTEAVDGDDLAQNEVDGWETFRFEPDEVLAGYGSDGVAVAVNDDYAAIAEEPDMLDAFTGLDDDDALSELDGVRDIAASVDDAGAFASILVSDGTFFEIPGGDGDVSDALLIQWDRAAVATVYDPDGDEYQMHIFLWHEDDDEPRLDDQAARLTAQLEQFDGCDEPTHNVDGAIVEASCVTDQPSTSVLREPLTGPLAWSSNT